MKTLQTLFIALFVVAMVPSTQAQTADEILENYFENTGGVDNWKKIDGMKMTGKAAMGPQEFPFTQTMMADGRMLTEVDFMGQNFIAQAFDGEQLWGMNFQTQEAEAQDAETSENYKKNDSKDFPDPFLNYKDKGYTLELMGEEMAEGTEVYKIKVNKGTVMVDGKEENNVAFYYFDKENFVPIMSESTINVGPQKGMKVQTVFSNYQEAGDIFYPYSIETKYNGQTGQSIKIEAIEMNPEVQDSTFKMPEKK
ncbi:MAG TPA: outer membrane lipoprotein-sorting protein [Flavobacteriaceae bacterium]|jgi:outer membrane lipoprotein-sorting protein|nr:outer membrane lipoprotein-sorting protein [Flavobacteriaceae bacterium]MAY52847.1 outer membrane lipoprotein-sorting protein [Flavobacteriaceae bacterium]HBR54493.1 outer membrane lipoprotein-sorting protein [Flavobacteriaceae bacterium]HIB47911.1 outer membrane lipoprotein-sorting protein [Flavobacteriaceae bacterium]HIN99359.1 outer membrane lipoprotein-sorting protein [Flavobacteriaceae bacterium]|tara:strand:+ start:143703 stop:144461 length:759 start_codon:yes stop_codon:yes gene_type:complete